MPLTMCIGADVAPMIGSFDAFRGNVGSLLDEALAERWLAADMRVFNLEAPLTDSAAPIEKCGMHLMAPTDCAAGIAALKPDAVGLCNNHIMDQGPSGLAATVRALSALGVTTFGAGKSAAEADEPVILEKNGARIGLYAVCEHEFSCALTSTPGANGLDELMLSDRIREIKRRCDRLVVLYHGGREYYPYPSPKLQKRCRHMVSCGADAVICQHSHCVGSAETFEGAPIVYGQGNFLFDMNDEPCFETGLLVLLTFTEAAVSASWLPIRRSHHGAALARGKDAEAILSGFSARSAELLNDGFVETKYRAYAAQYREKMLKVFLSGNPLLKGVNILYRRKPSRVYGKGTLAAIENTIACESLSELICEGLKQN